MAASLSRVSNHISPWAIPHLPLGDRPERRAEVVRRVLVVAACTGAALGLRALLGLAGDDIVPYATLFPAVGIATLFAGGWAGAATMALGWVGVWYIFLGPFGFSYLTPSQAIGALLYTVSAGLVLLTTVWLRATIVRLEQLGALREAAIEASTGIVVALSRDADWCEPQPKWEAVTGMRWPDYRGAGWLSTVHEADRPRLAALLESRVKEHAGAEVRVKAEDDWRWFAVDIVPVAGARAPFPDRVLTLTDVHEHKLARERQDLLLGEMRHRLKNLVGVIQALLSSSLPRNDASAAAIADKFMARLRAIEVAGDLVMAANWRDVEISAVVERVLAPFKETYKSRLAHQGPPLLLHEHTAGGIALACHELATNAVKYGALADEEGSITIDWSIEPEAESEAVVWQWQERHPRAVAPPEGEGFGLRVIRSAIVREQDAKVDITFPPQGLHCRMTFVRPRASAELKAQTQRAHS